MAVVGNIEETTASVVFDQGMWMGTANGSTAWLSGTTTEQTAAGITFGQAEKGVKLMILDVVVNAAGASSINLTSTGITGVSGTTGLAILSVNNMSGGFEVPTAVYLSGTNNAVINFTSGSGTAGDTHRITLLYA
tara:strand:+ start:326 stop:730 length:405 start_codon:yes stop_codon:yes gene_type:complete